jgi:hypothetical protein
MSCATGDVVYYSAPTLLPGVVPAMRTAGFWIGRAGALDEVVMTREKIENRNSTLMYDLSLVNPIGLMQPTIDGNTVRRELQSSITSLEKRTLYLKDGGSAGNGFYEPIERNMDEGLVWNLLPVRFAFAVEYGNVRLIPSNELLNDIPREQFLDHLQVSALDIGTPLAVLHRSMDGNWYFVRAPLFSGWVEERTIAFTGRSDAVYFCSHEPFVVATSPKAELWADSERTRYIGFVRMGTRLPLASCSPDGGSVCVEVPVRGSTRDAEFAAVFVSASQVHEGYIPFTKRTVMTQSFSLLDSPYGWGDMFGEQDCSRFVCEVFAVTGLELPRNSYAQASSGWRVFEFPETKGEEERADFVVANAVPGITLLRSPGHIMIYLGEYEGVPYVIHSFWAYEERAGFSDRLLMVNKTAVSTLLLGRGTEKGSYLKRLSSMTVIEEF